MKSWSLTLIVAVAGVLVSSAAIAAFPVAALDAATEAAPPGALGAAPPAEPAVGHAEPPAPRPDASAAPSAALELSTTVFGDCVVDCDDGPYEDLHSVGWMSYEECCSQRYTVCPDGKPRAAKGVITAEGFGQACFRPSPRLP